MAGGWGCPHELDDRCTKVSNLPCDPGMKGCVLAGRFVFANEDKNQRLREKQARAAADPGEEDATADAPVDTPVDNSGLHP